MKIHLSKKPVRKFSGFLSFSGGLGDLIFGGMSLLSEGLGGAIIFLVLLPVLLLLTIPISIIRKLLGKRQAHLLIRPNEVVWVKGKERRVFPVSSLQNIELRYCTALAEDPNGDSLKFQHQGEAFHFYLRISKGGFKRLCALWYRHKIPFREFCNRSRTFKLRKPMYKEIQKLKEEYGIVW